MTKAEGARRRRTVLGRGSVRQSFAAKIGVKGRKTGVAVKENVAKDANGMDDIDDFWDDSSAASSATEGIRSQLRASTASKASRMSKGKGKVSVASSFDLGDVGQGETVGALDLDSSIDEAAEQAEADARMELERERLNTSDLVLADDPLAAPVPDDEDDAAEMPVKRLSYDDGKAAAADDAAARKRRADKAARKAARKAVGKALVSETTQFNHSALTADGRRASMAAQAAAAAADEAGSDDDLFDMDEMADMANTVAAKSPAFGADAKKRAAKRARDADADDDEAALEIGDVAEPPSAAAAAAGGKPPLAGGFWRSQPRKDLVKAELEGTRAVDAPINARKRVRLGEAAPDAQTPGKRTRAKVATATMKGERATIIGLPKNELTWHEFPTEPNAAVRAKAKVAKAFSSGAFTNGLIVVPPAVHCAPVGPVTCPQVFCVASGTAQVTIYKTTFNISSGGHFFVPTGNCYQVANASGTKDLRLSFTTITAAP